jgi:hypothetical protein
MFRFLWRRFLGCLRPANSGCWRLVLFCFDNFLLDNFFGTVISSGAAAKRSTRLPFCTYHNVWSCDADFFSSGSQEERRKRDFVFSQEERMQRATPTALLVVTTKAEGGHKNHDDLVLDAHDLAGGGCGQVQCRREFEGIRLAVTFTRKYFLAVTFTQAQPPSKTGKVARSLRFFNFVFH